jgi:hypothetical protein
MPLCMTVTEWTVMELTPAQQCFVSNYSAELHKNPVIGLVAVTGSQTDGHGLHIKHSPCYFIKKA